MTGTVRLAEPLAADHAVVRILIVDDEVRNLDVLESILASTEHCLVRARTAQEALLALIDGEFAAIVLDIQMPGISGIELAHLIKQRKKTQHIPIIFLTAYYLEDKDILQGYEVGAVDYLTKPINSQILKSKIAVFVELFQKTRELAAVNRAMENEITQRQNAEEALRQANLELEERVRERMAAHEELAGQNEVQTRLFDATLSSIHDLAYTFDLEGNWIYANKPLLELWGKSLVDIAGKSSLDLGYPEELAERLKRQVKEVVVTHKAVKGETYFTSAAGVEDYHEYILSPVFARDGSVAAVCGTTRLTTERRRAEAAVRESEQRYSQLVSCLPAAVCTTDAQGRLTLYNEAAVALWGRRPQIGKDAWCGSYRLYRADGSPLPLDQCAMAMTLKLGRPVRGEEIIVERPDGSRRNVLPSPDLIRDIAGKLVGAVNMLLDITDRKIAEEASRRLAAIVKSSDDAIISNDLQGAITSWNRGAERLFGYPAEDVIGQPMTLLMPEDRCNEGPSILERIRQGEHVEHYETLRKHKEGRRLEVSLTISPIKDGDGRIIGASQIGRDISGQKQAERELERAHKEVLAASRAKDDFLAALSHELRTPLNPVLLLASDAAEDGHLPGDVRSKFATIRNGVELEARLIDDLLDITRIARGKLLLGFKLVDAHALLTEAVATVQSDFDQKQIALDVILTAEPATVNGDGVRLQQVFWNVLKNAAKFTPIGGRVSVRSHKQWDPDELVITVTDSGIGMTETEAAGIFEAFAQGDHAHTAGSHQFGGLGLGLAISRKLIEAHAGSIRAYSAGRDRGATFVITLPLRRQLNEKHVALSEKDRRPSLVSRNGHSNRPRIRILLVEDHEPTRTALAQLLTRRNYEVALAASVAEARALSAKQPFQLLISDIGLPDGNGFELMKELRAAHPGLRGIALTGYGMEEDVSRAREVGFISHLIKPIRVQTLETALAVCFAEPP